MNGHNFFNILLVVYFGLRWVRYPILVDDTDNVLLLDLRVGVQIGCQDAKPKECSLRTKNIDV